MTNQKTSKPLHIALWIAQVLASVTLAWAAYMKLFQSPAGLAAMWPWAGEVSPLLVKFTGVVDLLGALGLVLPMALRIRPGLTPIAATGVVILMVVASIFHISRGESSQIGFNVVFAAVAAFIAWGRSRQPKPAPAA